MRNVNRALSVIMAIGMAVLLCACGHTESAEDGGMVLYYVENGLTRLESRDYELRETQVDGQINEVISALSTTSDSLEYKAPFSFFTLIGLQFADRKLILDVDRSYTELPATTEILVRAAIVRSLAQIDGVDYVGFTVEGEQLYDQNGDPVGLMSADSFINNDGNEINTYELVKVKLKEVEEKDAIRNFKNPITGEYVMDVFGIEPCSEIGALKEMVKNAILDGLIPNEFEAADRYMRQRAPELGLKAVK